MCLVELEFVFFFFFLKNSHDTRHVTLYSGSDRDWRSLEKAVWQWIRDAQNRRRSTHGEGASGPPQQPMAVRPQQLPRAAASTRDITNSLTAQADSSSAWEQPSQPASSALNGRQDDRSRPPVDAPSLASLWRRSRLELDAWCSFFVCPLSLPCPSSLTIFLWSA